jgi:hypothetical protein
MTCELSHEQCEECNFAHCPDQIEWIRARHYQLIRDVKIGKAKLKRAQEDLEIHEKAYLDIL